MVGFENKEISVSARRISLRRRFSFIGKRLIRDRWLYYMLVPGILFFVIFKYGPMLGLVMAFENYSPFLGFLKSKWVGLAQFQRFISDPNFLKLFRNTMILGVYNLVLYFPMPIILSLMLNEVRSTFFKRTVQTLVYIPYFLSWVVVASITYTFFSQEGGMLNNLLVALGLEKYNPLMSAMLFRPMITLQLIWKQTGYGTIIVLAALTGIDPELYAAAEIDGAGRWQRLMHVTLPCIRSTIVILFILQLSSFIDRGFEQVFLMLNAINRDVGEIFDTYVYQTGILGGQFSYSAAVGLFKSAISLILVLSVNTIVKKAGEDGLF